MKKLQSNFTTPEQSKRLLELGVPEWTADCFHPTDLQQNPIEDATPTIITYQLDTHEIVWDKVYGFPCWSVGRLIEICCISMGMSGYPHTFENQVANLILMLSQAKKHMGVDFSKLEE